VRSILTTLEGGRIGRRGTHVNDAHVSGARRNRRAHTARIDALVAGDSKRTERRAECRHRSHGRHGLQRHRAVRIRDRHAEPRSPRRPRRPLHQLSHEPRLLTVARGAAHGPQSPSRRLRLRGQRGPRLPGIHLRDRARRAHAGRAIARWRLRDVRHRESGISRRNRR
jgi:hypothetical protein